MGFEQKNVKRLRRALVQDHLLYFVILNKLTDYLKSRAGLDEDHYKHRVLQTYANAWRPQLQHSRKKQVKTTGCKCWVIHEDGTVFSMDNCKIMPT